MRREGCPKQRREDFGDICSIENYKGSWAGFVERDEGAEPAIPVGRIVSKQNMWAGNEVCKMERVSLHRRFSPNAAKSLSVPEAHGASKCHSDRVTSLRFLKRYDFLLSSSLDGKVILHGDRPLRTFIGHSQGVSGMGLSFDEMSMITTSYDGWAKRWDVELGRCTGRWSFDEPITACSMEDRAMVVGGGEGMLGLIDSRCKEAVYALSSVAGCIVSLCATSSLVGLARSDGSIEFRELDSGRLFRSIQGSYRQILADATSNTCTACSSRMVCRFKDGQVDECWASQNQITRLCMAPAGEDIIYVNSNSELVYMRNSARLRISSHRATCLDVSSRDNRSVAIGFPNGRIEVWK